MLFEKAAPIPSNEITVENGSVGRSNKRNDVIKTLIKLILLTAAVTACLSLLGRQAISLSLGRPLATDSEVTIGVNQVFISHIPE